MAQCGDEVGTLCDSNFKASASHSSFEGLYLRLRVPRVTGTEESVNDSLQRDRFEAAFREHAARAYAVILRIVRDGDAANDVLQETFFAAWKSFASFRGEASLGTWLHQIAVRKAWKYLRRSRRDAHLVVVDSSQVAYREAAERAFPHTRMDLESAIASLPDGARSVLVLYEIEGFAYEEIAEMLGIAIGTVRSQLHRARRLLRTTLEPPDAGG